MYEYIQVYEFGLPTDKCYPYMAHNGPCQVSYIVTEVSHMVTEVSHMAHNGPRQDPAGPQPLSPVPLGCV